MGGCACVLARVHNVSAAACMAQLGSSHMRPHTLAQPHNHAHEQGQTTRQGYSITSVRSIDKEKRAEDRPRSAFDPKQSTTACSRSGFTHRLNTRPGGDSCPPPDSNA